MVRTKKAKKINRTKSRKRMIGGAIQPLVLQPMRGPVILIVGIVILVLMADAFSGGHLQVRDEGDMSGWERRISLRNLPPQVQRLVDFVLPSRENDGIYARFLQFLLGEGNDLGFMVRLYLCFLVLYLLLGPSPGKMLLYA